MGLRRVPAEHGTRSCRLPLFDQPLDLRNLTESFSLLDFQPQWNVLSERGARISHRCSLQIESCGVLLTNHMNAHFRGPMHDASNCAVVTPRLLRHWLVVHLVAQAHHGRKTPTVSARYKERSCPEKASVDRSMLSLGTTYTTSTPMSQTLSLP